MLTNTQIVCLIILAMLFIYLVICRICKTISDIRVARLVKQMYMDNMYMDNIANDKFNAFEENFNNFSEQVEDKINNKRKED